MNTQPKLIHFKPKWNDETSDNKASAIFFRVISTNSIVSDIAKTKPFFSIFDSDQESTQR